MSDELETPATAALKAGMNHLLDMPDAEFGRLLKTRKGRRWIKYYGSTVVGLVRSMGYKAAMVRLGRKIPLAVAIVALPLNYAHADLPVIDVSSLFQEIKSYGQDLQSYLTQLEQLTQEVQTATNMATMAVSFIGNPSLGTAMALMGMVGLDIELPINPYAVQSLLSGYGGATTIGGLTGKLSTLGSVVNRSYGDSHIYTCTDNSFACTQSQQTGYATSGQLGLLTHLYQKLIDHNATLQALRTDGLAAQDPKTRETVAGQAVVENAWHVSTSAQIEAINGMGAAQARIRDQQVDEKLRQDADAYLRAVPQ